MYEIFMPIESYEDTYAVSNLGRVKNIKTGRILKQSKENTGYMRVKLFKNNKGKHYSVHRLVLETFKANPDNKPQVNHINEDKTDNRLNNLEWSTPKENINHGSHNEQMASTNRSIGTYERLAERRSKQVYCITNNIIYSSAAEAARQLNLHSCNITACCKGRQKQTKGYKFQYYNEREGD